MKKDIVVCRRELKYLANYYDILKTKYALKCFLKEDPNNGNDGYTIRSLYFDSYSNTDYYDKLNGMANRKKIRLRIYSLEDKFVKLEIKKKFNDNQIKESVTISKEDALELIKCNYDVLSKYNSNASREIMYIMKTDNLIPVVLIEYKRYALMHSINNIRVTIDSDIRSSETCFDLFSKTIVLNPIDTYNIALIEVKYDGFLLKWITDILSNSDLNNASFSKYTSSRCMFENYLA